MIVQMANLKKFKHDRKCREIKKKFRVKIKTLKERKKNGQQVE